MNDIIKSVAVSSVVTHVREGILCPLTNSVWNYTNNNLYNSVYTSIYFSLHGSLRHSVFNSIDDSITNKNEKYI